MRLAIAQVDCQLGDVEANLATARKTVSEAGGVDLVVFPELSLTGYDVGAVTGDLSMVATDRRLRDLSSGTDAGVVVGFVEGHLERPRVYNTMGHYRGGELVHAHRKLYLPTYSIFEERKYFSPGQSMRAYSTAQGERLAILTCNDAWQPQLVFLATQDGAQVLLMPASSSQSRFPEHYDNPTYWRDITRFSARMFESYVVFANRIGTEGKLEFWGGSHVVDPWGEVIAEAPEDEPHLLTVDLDLARVWERRRQVPLVREARLGILQREIDRLVDEGGDL